MGDPGHHFLVFTRVADATFLWKKSTAHLPTVILAE